jgi:hypothetical protein
VTAQMYARSFHMSLTSIMINGIDNLDASKTLRVGKKIVQVSLRDTLYRLTLESGSPLFLQLSQRSSGEVDAVIPNNREAETKAERISRQVAAWCINYWKDTNPGGTSFFQKMACKAFCQVLLHKVNDCSWDSATQTVTTPNEQSELAEVVEFKNQDWVRDIIQATGTTTTEKAYADPNTAFPFQDNFSVGTIHGTNEGTKKCSAGQAVNDMGNEGGDN